MNKCDLLLLHWPDEAIERGTLGEMWGAMEAAKEAGTAAEARAAKAMAGAPAALLLDRQAPHISRSLSP